MNHGFGQEQTIPTICRSEIAKNLKMVCPESGHGST